MLRAEEIAYQHEIAVLRRQLSNAQVSIIQHQNKIDLLVEQGNSRLTELREVLAERDDARLAAEQMGRATQTLGVELQACGKRVEELINAAAGIKPRQVPRLFTGWPPRETSEGLEK